MDHEHASPIEMSPSEALGPLNDVELRNAPERLYLSGDVQLLRGTVRVSIVGSRRASQAGRLRAMRLARLLVARSVVVVSGLAEGIDTAAHRAAIDSGGRTIGVIGTPLSRSYPAVNRELQAGIAREQLLVSEFPEGRPVQRQNFILRNRTMALISHASVIIEAGETSGSLSQGREALRLGRPLFLARAVADRTDLDWPTAMIRLGARVLAVPEDLFAEIPPERFAAAVDAPF